MAVWQQFLMDQKRCYSQAEIAALLTSVGFRISAKTLARKAWEGRGPAYVVFGRPCALSSERGAGVGLRPAEVPAE